MAEFLHRTKTTVHIELHVDARTFDELVRASGGLAYALRALRLSAPRWLRQVAHDVSRSAPASVARGDARATPGRP